MSVRILHVVGDSKFGGASHGILRLARFWRSLGWEAELLTTDPMMLAAAAKSGVTTVPLDVIWREIRPIRDLVGLFRLYRYLQAHPYTLIHTHTTKAGFIGRVAARMASCPTIVHTAHGFAFHEESSTAKIAFYTMFERLASYCCDCVVAVSRFHRDWGIRLGMCPSKKWMVITNGIPQPDAVSQDEIAATRESWGVEPGTLVILNHGRVVTEKGLEDLVAAAHLLKHRLGRPFLVVFAGEGALRGELERMADALGVQNQVRFLGFRSDVTNLLAAADIVALPSLREGLSIALLEAMAMARPIIATTIGSNREVSREGEAALLIPPNAADSLADAIERLARDPDEALRLAKRAGEIYHEEYRIDRMMAGYHQLYLDLLTARGLQPLNSGEGISNKENYDAEPVSALLPSLDR